MRIGAQQSYEVVGNRQFEQCRGAVQIPQT